MNEKLKTLCDSYKKCLDREKEISKSGSGANKTLTCRYYNQWSLLRTVVANRQTISNVMLPALSCESTSPRTSSPALSFTSNSSHDADDLYPSEPSSETISRKASTTVKGKSSSAKRYKRAATMDPVKSVLIGNIQNNVA